MTIAFPRSVRNLAVLTVLAVLAVASAARADTVTSDNWSGYAVHGSGVTFRSVSGTWVQPESTCVSGTKTYSAFWVGIGGYSLTSSGLEQVGTELDCSSDGTAVLSAWYELVPGPGSRDPDDHRPGRRDRRVGGR